jgi:hypothetical protein
VVSTVVCGLVLTAVVVDMVRGDLGSDAWLDVAVFGGLPVLWWRLPGLDDLRRSRMRTYALLRSIRANRALLPGDEPGR